ncbi:MAG: hypothetical protein ACTSSA_15705 [Candidatus Freyarchaeota archaeon]
MKKLVQLQAKTARVVRDGKEVEIPIEEVAVGDVLTVLCVRGTQRLTSP